MGDDITIGVTEIVNNIEVTAQPNDQIVDISVIDNTDEVTLNITPTVIEINVNKGSSFAKWGDILGTLSDQEDLQDALDLKADLVDGKVPSSQLPSYVDDVIEVANYAALPVTGESGKIYITIDNNHIFRWTGSIYVEITDNTAVWGAITGTLSSQTDLVTALNLRVPYTGATGDVNLGTYDIKAQKYWMLDEVNSNYGSMHFTDGNYHIEDADGHKLFVIEDGFMQLHKTDTIQSNLYTSNLTAVRDHYLPDASGTLALDENVVHKTGDETISGRKTFNSTTDIGIRSNISGNGYGIYSENSSNGISFYVANNGSGKAFSVSNTLGSFGNMYEGSYNGTSNFAVNYLGEITASKFIKSGGTAFEFLKANGDVDSNIYFKGSVTAGYLPKSLYPSSGDFTTSLIYDDGTNIGIGTTSPSGLLHLQGNSTSPITQIIDNLNAGTSAGTRISFRYQGTETAYIYNRFNGGDFNTDIGSADYLRILTAGSEKMRILTNGNVGIGTTNPSEKLTLTNGKLFLTEADPTIGGKIYGYNDTSTDLYGGGLKFQSRYYDGANYVYADRLTIKGSGNVGIGTTSPSAKLDVNGIFRSIVTSISSTGEISAKILGYPTSPFGLIFRSYSSGATSIQSQREANDSEFFSLSLQPNGGNVGIGTTSPSTICHLYKASFPILTIQSSSYQSSLGIDTTSGNLVLNNESNAPLSFNTNATERMRITSGGNVGIGTTSPSFQLQLSNDSAAKPGSPLWTVSSDIRIKENVRPYTDGLEKLMQVNPVYYDYNGKAGFSITKDNVGIIAQEMQEVLPNTIKTFKAKLNDDDEEETELLSFNANEIIYVLINSVKELKAEIEILKNK